MSDDIGKRMLEKYLEDRRTDKKFGATVLGGEEAALADVDLNGAESEADLAEKARGRLEGEAFQAGMEIDGSAKSVAENGFVSEEQRKRASDSAESAKAGIEETLAEADGKIKELENEAPKNVIDEEISGQFDKNFGLSEKDLGQIEGFSELTKGQQLLVVENMKQWLLGEVKMRAISNLEDKKGEYKTKSDFLSFSLKDTASWKLFNLARLGMFKKSRLTKLAKKELDALLLSQDQEADDAEKSGKKDIKHLSREALQQFINKTREQKLEVNEENGWPAVNYLQTGEAEKLGIDKELAAEFNSIASTFSRLPAFWGTKTHRLVNRQEYENYQRLKAVYEESRRKLESSIEEAAFDAEWKKREDEYSRVGHNEKADSIKYVSEKAAFIKTLSVINRINSQVISDQYLNANPEAEQKLLSIKNTNLLKRAAENLKSEKGLSFVTGLIARKASKTALALSAAAGTAAVLPAIITAGAGFGAWRGRIRGKENLENKEYFQARSRPQEKAEKEARKEYFNELVKLRKKEDLKPEDKARIAELGTILQVSFDKIKRNYVSSDVLSGKLDGLIEQVEKSGSEIEKNDLLGKLRVRINYTRKKLEDGLVNFGHGGEIIDNTLKMQLKIAEALNFIEAKKTSFLESGHRDIQKKHRGSELEARLESLLESTESSVTSRQKSHVRAEMLKGAAFGAGGALAGYTVGSAINRLRTWFGEADIAGNFKKTGKMITGYLNSDQAKAAEIKYYKTPKLPADNSFQDAAEVERGGAIGTNTDLQKNMDDPDWRPDESAVNPDRAKAVSATERAGNAENAVSARIEIKGKIDTVSEAVGKILASDETSEWVKKAFVARWLGDGNDLNPENLGKALQRMSAANIKIRDGRDIANLIHAGDRISLGADGGVVVEESSGLKSKIVSESELRSTAAKPYSKIEPMSRAEAGLGVEVPVGTDQLYDGPAMKPDLSKSGKFFDAWRFQSPGEKKFYDNQPVSSLADPTNFKDVRGGFNNQEFIIPGEGDGGLDQDTLQYHPNSEPVKRPDGAEIMTREGIADFLKQAEKDGFRAREGEKLSEYLARYEQSLKGGASAVAPSPPALETAMPEKIGEVPVDSGVKLSAEETAKEQFGKIFDQRVGIKDRAAEIINGLKGENAKNFQNSLLAGLKKEYDVDEPSLQYVKTYYLQKLKELPEDSNAFNSIKARLEEFLEKVKGGLTEQEKGELGIGESEEQKIENSPIIRVGQEDERSSEGEIIPVSNE